MYYPKNAYAIIGTYMDPLYVNYDKRKNATSNSAVPTPTANTMPVFGAPAANTSAPTATPAPTAPAPATHTAPVAPAPAPAPAPIAPAAPTITPSLEPAPAASPANTLVAELDTPVVEQNPFASFQNNTPAAEPQPVQQFAPAEQPLQTQPIGPAPVSSGTGDIVLDMSQPKGGINKKLLAIIGGVVLVAIVAVIAVFFLIPKQKEKGIAEVFSDYSDFLINGPANEKNEDAEEGEHELVYAIRMFRAEENDRNNYFNELKAKLGKLSELAAGKVDEGIFEKHKKTINELIDCGTSEKTIKEYYTFYDVNGLEKTIEHLKEQYARSESGMYTTFGRAFGDFAYNKILAYEILKDSSCYDEQNGPKYNGCIEESGNDEELYHEYEYEAYLSINRLRSEQNVADTNHSIRYDMEDLKREIEKGRK